MVCRDEKVPMTAPMAAKTCVRLGTPSPAPPLPPERNQFGSSTPNWRRKRSARQLARLQRGVQRARGWSAGSLPSPPSAPHMPGRTGPAARGEPSEPGPAAPLAGGRRRRLGACLALGTGRTAARLRLRSRRRVRCGSRAPLAPPAARSAPRPALGLGLGGPSTNHE